MASNLITILKLGLTVTFLYAVIGGGVTTVAAISCGQVVTYLTPCIPYVTGGGYPSSNCCSGVKQLSMAARTTPDRQAVCLCLKSLVSVKYNGQSVANAAALPTKCGVTLPYSINPNVDCNTIKM